jgi:hypothetical protein
MRVAADGATAWIGAPPLSARDRAAVPDDPGRGMIGQTSVSFWDLQVIAGWRQ